MTETTFGKAFSAEQVEAMKKITVGAIPFADRTGIELVEVRPGYVKMKIPLDINRNHIGTMYAGALFTLAEIPGGALFMATFDFTKFYPIVAEMNIRFRRPATTEITVEASISEQEVVRVQEEAERDGKSIYILEEELKDTNGEIVAIARGTYQARKR